MATDSPANQIQRNGPHSQRRGARYDAPGDPPLEAEALTINVPFKFGADMARRLSRRDVNPKEAFTVRNGDGVYYRASLKDLTPTGGWAIPYEHLPCTPDPTIELTLACAVLARQRMIFVMQKATELGVSSIVPVLTEFSVKPHGLEHEKAHAWPGQVVRAVKQCRRSSLPAVLPPTTLQDLLNSPVTTGAELTLFLDDRSDSAPPETEAPKRIVLLVGPEGGFSPQERSLLQSRGKAMALGGRVLRAETAVLAGLTAVQMIWGDYRSYPRPSPQH